MFTRKSMLQCQKMIAYIEIFDDLIVKDTENFVRNRKESDAAHALLIEAAQKALDDPDIKE